MHLKEHKENSDLSKIIALEGKASLQWCMSL